MSVQPIEPAPTAPVASSPAPGAPEAPKPTEPVATAPEAPPWGEDFDAEKAWKLVQNLRADKETLSKREALTPEQKAKLSEYDKVLESQKTAEQKAQDAAAAAEKRAQALVDRATRAEIKALAADGFADPSDAIGALDSSKYVTPEGDVDTEAIKSDLADLLARKPHWAKSPASRVPAPNPAQGASGSGAGGVAQLSESDVQRMYAAKDYEGIAKAEADGRLNKVLGRS